jgi:RimJ/RimL family protein N-acetyltransferase
MSLTLELKTPRLLLRPFTPDDVEDVLEYTGDPEWARYQVNILPHPYSRKDVQMLATCDPGNVGSCRVLEKLGMKREGQLRRHVLWNGEFRDQVCYGILRAEWERPGGSRQSPFGVRR